MKVLVIGGTGIMGETLGEPASYKKQKYMWFVGRERRKRVA